VSSSSLDRAAALRDDDAALAAAAARPDAMLLPVHDGRSLVGHDRDGALRARFVSPALAADAPLAWLGLLDGAPLFAADLSDRDGGAPAVEGCDWEELRRALPLLPAEDFELLAFARALVHWHRTHRWCGACGAPTAPRRGGHERGCAACGLTVYPRTDPAVIVVVGDAQRVLLGRQAAWDAGRYSAIAGFVEPGETLEAAVLREVREETGISAEIVPTSRRYGYAQPRQLPPPVTIGIYDIDEPRRPHQHIDLIYFTRPLPGERLELPSDGNGWLWVSEDELRTESHLDRPDGAGSALIPEDVRQLGLDSIAAVRALEADAA